jgi:hypothetical protein
LCFGVTRVAPVKSTISRTHSPPSPSPSQHHNTPAPKKQNSEYHAAAAKDFREKVLAPFFVGFAARRGHSLDQASFTAALNDLHARQLAATLKYLEPANALPLWSVTVKAT